MASWLQVGRARLGTILSNLGVWPAALDTPVCEEKLSGLVDGQLQNLPRGVLLGSGIARAEQNRPDSYADVGDLRVSRRFPPFDTHTYIIVWFVTCVATTSEDGRGDLGNRARITS